MSSITWDGWVSILRDQWLAKPQCSAECCGSSRRVWRRLCWWNPKILLGGQPYCLARCFENAARQRFSQVAAAPINLPTVHHRIPLGLLMLSRGQLSDLQLLLALEAQENNRHRRLGEWLQQLGYATEQQVTAALGQQWSCPVLSVLPNLEIHCAAMLPRQLSIEFRLFPLQFVAATRTLYVAFDEGIDYTALYALEQMLDCRTQACLVRRSTMNQALDRIADERLPADLLLSEWCEPSDMARITSGYALKLGSEKVRIIRFHNYIWARLETGTDIANLLFRRPLEQCEGVDPNSHNFQRVAG